MKLSPFNWFVRVVIATSCLATSHAADLLWDGASVGDNGDGVSTYAAGTWSTANANWDAGNGLARVVWNNASIDNATFAGTYAAGTKTVTIGSNITVNQIQVNTGSTGANRYDIGASNAQNDFAITFGGTYSDAFPAITGSSTGFLNTNFNAKITGTLNGGLVLKHGTNITTPGSSGRFAFTNANNDFTGDVVVAGGNLGIATNAAYGNAANKIVLKGGALFVSGGAGTTTLSRNLEVAAASGISSNSVAVGQIIDLTGTISGSGALTRYSNSLTGSNSSEVRLSGDLSGYTGTIENTGNNANATITIQTTATSGGAWKLTGGTVKLNTADNTHIADGVGKSDLLLNGGALDLNGKNETINGLSGATGNVRNQAASTASVLTIGAGDATASFGGTLQDNSGTGGTLALTKIGTGSQTLAGNASHTGATTVEAGSLVTAGTLDNSPVTVKSGAKFIVSNAGKILQALSLENGSTFSAPLDTGGSYLMLDDALTLNGGTVTLIPTFSSAPALGTYDFIVPVGGITGSATFVADFSAGASRFAGTAQIVSNNVTVKITSIGAALTWNNQTANATWDLNTSANFLNGAANDVFKQYDTVTFGPSSPSGTITLAGSLLSASVTVNSSNNLTFAGSGSITGPATLTKTGSGTLTLANANTFTGDTTVSGGTLTVNGSLGSGAVLVESAATLAGTGSIGGALTIDGTVSPGPGIGTLAVTAASGVGLYGTYACDLDGATADKLAVTGNLSLSDATLALNIVSPPTATYYVIATYTGTLSGSFASLPAGYLIDTSEPGKVVLRTPAVPPPAGTITFETDQGYPATAEIAGTNTDLNGAAFSGADGWSLSVGGGPGAANATSSSGEYLGGQALGCSTSGTFTSGRIGGIQRTGAATLTFDTPFVAGGTAVGFMKDTDGDGLFETGHPSGGTPGSGLSFGIGGSPARFQYRDAGFGAEHPSGITGVTGHWYRYGISIGSSIGGSRSITLTLRDLTDATDVDFDPVTAGVQPWTFSVTDAQFGTAPELSDGIFVRATSTSRIDNIRATSINPPAGTAYDSWLAGFPILTGNDRLPDADPDHDGIKNLLEFLLNGNPTLSDASILPAGVKSGSDLTFTFNRRDDSEGLVNPIVQYGDNLSTWTDVVIGALDGSSGGAGYTVAPNGNGTDRITVTLPTNGNPKNFVRLKAQTLAP